MLDIGVKEQVHKSKRRTSRDLPRTTRFGKIIDLDDSFIDQPIPQQVVAGLPVSQDKHIGKFLAETDLSFYEPYSNIAYDPRTGILYCVKFNKVSHYMTIHSGKMVYFRNKSKMSKRTALRVAYEVHHKREIQDNENLIPRDANELNTKLDNIAVLDNKQFLRYRSAVKNLNGYAKITNQERNRGNMVVVRYMLQGKIINRCFSESVGAMRLLDTVLRYSALVLAKYSRSE